MSHMLILSNLYSGGHSQPLVNMLRGFVVDCEQSFMLSSAGSYYIVLRALTNLGVSQQLGYLCGVPIIRVILSWGLHGSTPISGNYHLGLGCFGLGVSWVRSLENWREILKMGGN